MPKPYTGGVILRARPLLVDARGVSRDLLGASPVEFEYYETANDSMGVTTTPAILFTGNTFFMDGKTRVLAEMFLAYVNTTTDLYITLLDNGAGIANSYQGFYSAPYVLRAVYTPARGNHTLSCYAQTGSSTATIGGGGAIYAPCFLRASAI